MACAAAFRTTAGAGVSQTPCAILRPFTSTQAFVMARISEWPSVAIRSFPRLAPMHSPVVLLLSQRTSQKVKRPPRSGFVRTTHGSYTTYVIFVSSFDGVMLEFLHNQSPDPSLGLPLSGKAETRSITYSIVMGR